jgi:CheY-like chemotaxis protein
VADLALFQRRLTIVDDNPLNLEVADLTMQKFGFKNYFAENGDAAIALVKKRGAELDVILIDLQMPILDGFQAAEQIRQLPQGKQIPIIAVSARAFDSDKERCFAAGINEHVAKPFERKELFSKLTKVMRPGSRS